MLSNLLITDIALIDKLEIEFGDGLNCLTGETGAGKSVVVDSIGFMLGARSSRDLIRSGAESCSVTGTFYTNEENIKDRLTEMGIEPESDGMLLIHRELSTSGKNICRINGRVVTLSMLREISELLIDIHGQHDNTTLMDPANHLDFVDSYGDVQTSDAYDSYVSDYKEYCEVKAEIAEGNMSPEERERKTEELQRQIREIEGTAVKDGELEELTEKQKILENSEEIAENLSQALSALDGEDGEGGAITALSVAAKSLEKISDVAPDYDEAAKRFNDILYGAQDLLHDLNGLLDESQFSPAELAETEKRIDAISDLQKKYGDNLNESLSKAQKDLNDLEDSEEEALKQAEHFTEITRKLTEDGENLTAVRKSVAEVLSKDICRELGELEMPGAAFETEIYSCDSFGASGTNTAEFLVSANRGEPVKPVSKIASGGELSRIMLAVKSILADMDMIPTLIFDEIDVGISGKTAATVGEKLKKISNSHQVICVTHSTQIAVKADNNILLSKKESGEGRTIIHAETLDENQKIREIARLLDGNPDSQIAINHAKALVEAENLSAY